MNNLFQIKVIEIILEENNYHIYNKNIHGKYD